MIEAVIWGLDPSSRTRTSSPITTAPWSLPSTISLSASDSDPRWRRSKSSTEARCSLRASWPPRSTTPRFMPAISPERA